MEDMVIIHKVYRFLDYPTFIKAMLVFLHIDTSIVHSV